MAKELQQADEIEAVADALFTLMPMVVSHINERLEDLDMTNNDLYALRSIDGPMPMKDLATCMNYDPSYVTAVADRLESLELVERQPHPTDRRVKNLALTAKGKELKQNLPEKLWTGPNTFSALSGEQREQLLDILQVLTPCELDEPIDM